MLATGSLPPEQAGIIAELEATFGGGINLPWGWAALDPGPDWHGWYVHAYGPAGLWDLRKGTPRIPFVVSTFAPDPSQPDIHTAVQIWVFRAGLYGSPIALERRCKPGMPERVALAGLDRPHTSPNVSAAHSGLPLIGHAQNLPEIGRPASARQEMVNQLARAMRDVARRDSSPLHRVTWTAIAKELIVSEGTVRYWRKLAAESVPEITKGEVVAAAEFLTVSSGDRTDHV